jgi:multiple sugar transport system ATP-binding protein
MAKVLIENLYKIYPGDKGAEVCAVENVNLQIEDEEFMVFVGPSGCGKSTTLRMVAGLEEISKGSIYIDGKRINDVPPKDRDIAMVFQNYALYPHMTVYRNMAFGLELRKLPRIEIDQRVREAAQILGLTDEMLLRKPKALSGGQRQRVAVGRSIVRKPKVFLFDEPLSNLDAKMRVQMRAEISKLHARLNNTMIYVTHDQVEAMTMGDRICVMKDGRVQQVAQPLEIYNQPANMFVAGFIGSPPMNFFHGTILKKSGRLFFSEAASQQGEGKIILPVDAIHMNQLAEWVGKPVALGLRPEDIEGRATVGEVDPETIFKAQVEVVEPMGAETYLYLSSGAHSFISRSRSQVLLSAKENAEFVADMAKAHFFAIAGKEPFRTNSDEVDLDKWHAACRAII